MQRALGTSVKAALVKGRRNYLCPHRLADELKDVTMDSTIPVDQLNAIADWSQDDSHRRRVRAGVHSR